MPRKLVDVIKSYKFWLTLAVGLITVGFSTNQYMSSFASTSDLKAVSTKVERTESDVSRLSATVAANEKILYMILENTVAIGKTVKAPNLKAKE